MNRSQLEHNLDQLMQRVNRLAMELYAEDSLIVVGLTNYGFIRLSGHIEKCHQALFGNYVSNASSKAAHRFVDRALGRLTNLNAQKCVDLLTSFCPIRGRELSLHPSMQEGGKWKIALDDTYNVRNSQAHGGGQTMNLANLNQFVGSLKDYFNFIEKKLSEM